MHGESSKERISYGVITVASQEAAVQWSLIEKPNPKMPFGHGIIGKYIAHRTFGSTARSFSQPDGEIRLIDGFRTLLTEGKSIYALEVEGTRYDTAFPRPAGSRIAFAKRILK